MATRLIGVNPCLNLSCGLATFLFLLLLCDPASALTVQDCKDQSVIEFVKESEKAVSGKEYMTTTLREIVDPRFLHTGSDLKELIELRNTQLTRGQVTVSYFALVCKVERDLAEIWYFTKTHVLPWSKVQEPSLRVLYERWQKIRDPKYSAPQESTLYRRDHTNLIKSNGKWRFFGNQSDFDVDARLLSVKSTLPSVKYEHRVLFTVSARKEKIDSVTVQGPGINGTARFLTEGPTFSALCAAQGNCLFAYDQSFDQPHRGNLNYRLTLILRRGGDVVTKSLRLEPKESGPFPEDVKISAENVITWSLTDSANKLFNLIIGPWSSVTMEETKTNYEGPKLNPGTCYPYRISALDVHGNAVATTGQLGYQLPEGKSCQ